MVFVLVNLLLNLICLTISLLEKPAAKYEQLSNNPVSAVNFSVNVFCSCYLQCLPFILVTGLHFMLWQHWGMKTLHLGWICRLQKCKIALLFSGNWTAQLIWVIQAHYKCQSVIFDCPFAQKGHHLSSGCSQECWISCISLHNLKCLHFIFSLRSIFFFAVSSYYWRCSIFSFSMSVLLLSQEKKGDQVSRHTDTTKNRSRKDERLEAFSRMSTCEFNHKEFTPNSVMHFTFIHLSLRGNKAAVWLHACRVGGNTLQKVSCYSYIQPFS